MPLTGLNLDLIDSAITYLLSNNFSKDILFKMDKFLIKESFILDEIKS